MVLDIIGIAIAVILYALAIDRFMEVFFGKRRTAYIVMFLSYLPLLLLIGLNATLFGYAHISGLLFVPLGFFFITLNYESSMFKRIVAAFYILIVAETVATIVCNFLCPHLPTWNSVSPDTVASVITALLFYLSALLMFKYFKHIRKNTFNFHAFFVLVLIIAGTFAATTLYDASTISRSTYLDLYFFLLAGSTFMVFYLYNTLSKAHEEKLKSALHTQEKEYYLTQCQLMQESVKQAKSIRHDMKLHLATVKGYLADNKEATNYLNGLLGDIDESEVYSDTGNIAFDSIINYKLRNAKSDKIKLDLRVSVPSVLNVEVVDVVTILGNLFDNALDAIAKTEEKKIKLDIEFSKGVLFMKMENAFDGTVKYAEGRAEEERAIISLKGSKDHGYGLENIKKSVEKYNGHVNIAHEENIFSVGILLFVDDV